MTSFHVCVPVCVISGKLAAQKIERGQESHSIPATEREREGVGRRLRRHSVDFLLVTKERKNDGRLLCFVFPPLQDQSLAALISSASEFAHPAIHHRRGGLANLFSTVVRVICF